jgi:hypothetical protein
MYRSRLVFALAMAALAAILLPSSLPAQITFQRVYGGDHADFGYSVQQTTDSGYIVAGMTSSFGAGLFDLYLIKTDTNGDTLWTRSCGGSAVEEGFSVQQTTDGGYIITGSICSIGVSVDVYLVRTNASGCAIWTRAYGGLSDDVGLSVRQTTDGGYIVAGRSGTSVAGSQDVYIVKTNASGDTLWTRTLGGSEDDQGHSVQQTSDGGYIVVGNTWSFGAGGYDVYLIKTDSAGDTLWTRTCGGADYDWGMSVQQTADGGYIITGTTYSFGAVYADVLLTKADARGETLWTRTFGGAHDDRGCSVQQTRDGGYVIAGWTNSLGAGDNDLYLIKTDAAGDTLWTRTYGGAYDDYGYSVQQTVDGGYIVAGYTGSDVYLIKTDTDGHVAVAEPKASPTRTPALSLSCEPNPCRGRTAISLQLTADSPAELAIFDAGGRRVRTFTVNRTPYTVWDGTDELGHALPSGAYFVLLDAGGQHATTRLVLQR